MLVNGIPVEQGLNQSLLSHAPEGGYMNLYQLASILQATALTGGFIMMLIALLMPRGWSSPPGIFCILLGGGSVAACLVKNADGVAYIKVWIAWLMT